MWTTDCVFQGRQDNSRGFDLNNAAGTFPQLYVEGVVPVHIHSCARTEQPERT